MTVVSEGTCLFAPRFQVPEALWRAAMPDADRDGQVRIGFNLAHIRIGAASILVDPGFDDPPTEWSRAFAAKWPGVTRTAGTQAILAGLGIRPDEITHVLITHAHDDHFAGITVAREGGPAARYPNARHLIGRADWHSNPRRADPASDLTVRLGIVERLGLLDLVEGEREMVPGVTMIPAPGETPGHCIVRVASGGERFYYVGDLFHHACEVAHATWISPGRDEAAMVASRARVIAEASAQESLVIFSHERFPAWGHIVPAGAGYRWARAEQQGAT